MHTNAIYGNAGWVKGTQEAHGEWGGYLWWLENEVAFETSATNIWVSPYGVTNYIAWVLVGTIGDYEPMTNVVDRGPRDVERLTNYAGAGVAEDALTSADYRAFYVLLKVDLGDDGANTTFGFDDKTTPAKPWVCVEKFGSTQIKAVIDPASAVDQIHFCSGNYDGEKFGFSPLQPTASPQEVTIAGPCSEPIGWLWAEGTFYARVGCAASSCPAFDEMGVFVGEDTRPPTRYFVVSDPNNSATMPGPVPSDPNAEISTRWLRAAITPNTLASIHTLQIPYDTPSQGGDGDGKLDNTGIELTVLVEGAAQAIGLPNRSAEATAIWVFFVEDIHFVQSSQDQAVGGFQCGNDCFVATGSRSVTLVSQIAAHEWGHAIGCGHVNDPFTGNNLMYRAISGIADFISLWSWREIER